MSALVTTFAHQLARRWVARGIAGGCDRLVARAQAYQDYADDLLADRKGAIGYLLKDRVSEVAEFLRANAGATDLLCATRTVLLCGGRCARRATELLRRRDSQGIRRQMGEPVRANGR